MGYLLRVALTWICNNGINTSFFINADVGCLGVAVVMRKIGLPTIMGELVMGCNPSALGWVTPNEVISTPGKIGIFFLMLHTGVETEPREFYAAVMDSFGIALIGNHCAFTKYERCAALCHDITASIFCWLNHDCNRCCRHTENIARPGFRIPHSRIGAPNLCCR
ncbi:MAG: cation:proton antiporter [Candidatus Methanofishera endochildressiae]|uniref:Cation:proton antiporter n=1 Tax=Candidatus Methanofishera endochildressiae TaxID=2738884 RepID=A0A7Z0SE74_9GAMM|nr:cation:proton antiporter [Candidatus Methanofishera endochildressiae]